MVKESDELKINTDKKCDNADGEQVVDVEVDETESMEGNVCGYN